MARADELAAALRRNFDGKPWHGSSLVRIVASVAPERAFTRPAPEIRSIAELLAHTIAWMEIVTERLRGANPEVTTERDFPSVDGVAWEELVARLHRAFAALLDAVGAIDDDAKAYMVDGLLHHTTYHAALQTDAYLPRLTLSMTQSQFAPITFGRVIRARRAGALTFTQTEHTPRSALAMHAHERANIMFVLSGAFGERLPGRSVAVAPHDIVIKAPGERHANDYGNAAARSLTIEMDESWLAAQPQFRGLLSRTAHVRDAVAADALLRLLREVGEDDHLSGVAAEELVIAAAAALARSPLPGGKTPFIAAVRAYLDQCYLEPVSLTNVARAFGIERTLLARLFRRATGHTIGGYVRMLRVQRACHGLIATSRSIADVAMAAGFADHAHLCRVFKSIVGTTPTEFRRLRS